MKLPRGKKHFEWGLWAYIVMGIIAVLFSIAGFVSYMSINNWDIRCAFTDCTPITIKEK